MNKYNEENEIMKFGVKWLIILVIIMLMIGGITWFFSRSVTVLDTAIVRYEEFQEIYNTTQKVNNDICNMRNLKDTDSMFLQFSKAQRINTLKTTLNRWVEDYNSKSKMFNRSLWKSNSLPYQLSTNEFNCYGE